MKLRVLFAVALTLSLAACGFQLRGSAELGFNTLYIALPESSELRAALERTITSGSNTRIAANPQEADAVLTVTRDFQGKNILSLSSAGRVREHQLVRTVHFRVATGKGEELLPEGEIVLRRDLSYNDNVVLAKEAEEQVLWRDIQNDLVQQILRRLAAAARTPAASAK